MQPTPSGPTSDSSLVLACQDGDMAAFEALYRAYFGPVYDFAVRTTKDPNTAADLAQDAFIKAHARIGQLRNPEAFRPWLYAIVRREALNRFRDQSRESVVSTLEGDDMTGTNPLLSRIADDPAHDPAVAAEFADSASLVWDAAASLDADTYTVLDLHVRRGLTSAEIADVLGISKGNAYTKVNRMKERTAGAISTYLLIRQGSKDCTELHRMVAAEHLPPVTAKLRRAVDRHAKACDTCDERRKKLVAPMSIFAALAAVPPPTGLEDAIWDTVSSTSSGGGPTRRHLRRRWIPVAVGAAIIALVGAVSGVGIAALSRDSGSPVAVSSPTTIAAVPTTPGDPVGAPDDPTPSATTTTSTPTLVTSTTPTALPAPPPSVTTTTTTTASTTVPATTTLPDTTPPTLATAIADPTEIWELDSATLSCPATYARVALVSVDATDTGSGIANVSASWTIGGTPTTVAMTASGSIYTTEFGPFTYPTVADNTAAVIDIVVVATDVAGNTTKTTLAVTVDSLATCFG